MVALWGEAQDERREQLGELAEIRGGHPPVIGETVAEGRTPAAAGRAGLPRQRSRLLQLHEVGAQRVGVNVRRLGQLGQRRRAVLGQPPYDANAKRVADEIECRGR